MPTIVYEEKASYTDHDRLFKELISTFFKEFMEAFFPDEHAYINYSTAKFLEQEVFTDILKGEKRRIDILAEAKLQGEDRLVLIHVEPQSTYQKEFHERMFVYCSRLYEKYRKPILPIAVFSYNDKRDIPETFSIHFPTLHILEFRFLQLHLVKKNWRAYIINDNPVAAALLSKMGYTEEERVQVKVEFLRMVSRMELDPARMELIYGFFDTYMNMNEKEEEKVRKEIAKLPEEEAEKVLHIPNSYFERGMRKGMKKGKEEGKEEGIVQGIEKGIEQIVFAMLKNGYSEDMIADMAGLSVEKVKEIKGKINKSM